MTTTEYGIAENVAGKLINLPHCGSWYTDRYYTNDLTGRAAAEAAIGRIVSQVPAGHKVPVYEVVELRTFERPLLPVLPTPEQVRNLSATEAAELARSMNDGGGPLPERELRAEVGLRLMTGELGGEIGPLTESQLREWFALRGNPTGAYLDELLDAARGKTADELDAEYAALHGDMA